MKRLILLFGLLGFSLSILAQTDSCAIYLGQTNKATEDLDRAIAYSRLADCYQHGATTLVKQDSLHYLWAVAGAYYSYGRKFDLAEHYFNKAVAAYDTNPALELLNSYLWTIDQKIHHHVRLSQRPEVFKTGARLYAIPMAQFQAAKDKQLLAFKRGEIASSVESTFTIATRTLLRAGQLETARQYAQRSLAILHTLDVSDESLESQGAWNDLGDVQKALGEFAGAEQIYQKLYAQIQHTHQLSPIQRMIKEGIYGAQLAGLKETIGQAEQSQILLRQCIQEIEVVQHQYESPDSAEARKRDPYSYDILLIQHGKLVDQLANLLVNMGMVEEANPLYLQALAEKKRFEKLNIGVNPLANYLTTLENTGINFAQLGQFARADEYFKQALTLADTVYGRQTMSFAQSQLRIYSSAWGQRLGETAIAKCREAINNPTLVKSSLLLPATTNFCSLLLANGRYQQADSVAAVVWTKTKGQYPYISETTRNFLEKRLLIAINRRQYPMADSLFGQLLALDRTLLLNRFLGLTESEKQRLTDKFRHKNQFATYAISRLKANPALADSLYTQQLDDKGVLLWSQQQLQRAIRASADTSLKHTFSAYQTVRQKLSAASTLTEQQRNAIRLDSLENIANRLEKELVLQMPAFASQRNRFTSQQVRQVLKPGEAALELIRFQPYTFDSAGRTTSRIQYAALLLKPNAAHPDVILLTEGAPLEVNWFKQWQQAIQTRQTDKLSYNRYWQAIAQHLVGVKRLYFAADGVYHLLNPATLLNPKTNRYVLDEVEVVPVSSTRNLLSQSTSVPTNQKALLVGFPAYDLPKARYTQLLANAHLPTSSISDNNYTNPVLLRDAGWQPLPGTKQEVEQISRLLQQKQYRPTVLIGEEALEERVKTVQSPAVLHIATHAFFNTDNGSRPKNSFPNPMLRSGLILAGAQHRDTTLAYVTNQSPATDDGILTALEATDLTLDSTQLVVLSACQTGLGVVRNGEGVYGLQRAFRIAGAKALLMSLWKVTDTSTQHLMNLFYQNWLSGQTHTEALRQAQKQVRQQPHYATPYYWGAFVLID